MSVTTLVSVEEYLATTRDPDCDYVDGEILERNQGETEHGRLQAALTGWLYANRKRLGIHVFTETRVQVKPARFPIPDIRRVRFSVQYLCSFGRRAPRCGHCTDRRKAPHMPGLIQRSAREDSARSLHR